MRVQASWSMLKKDWLVKNKSASTCVKKQASLCKTGNLKLATCYLTLPVPG